MQIQQSTQQLSQFDIVPTRRTFDMAMSIFDRAVDALGRPGHCPSRYAATQAVSGITSGVAQLQSVFVPSARASDKARASQSIDQARIALDLMDAYTRIIPKTKRPPISDPAAITLVAMARERIQAAIDLIRE